MAYNQRLEQELAALAINEDNLNSEIRERLRRIPKDQFLKLGRYFKPGGVYGTLINPAPARGGVDAWRWVENGHSWNEITEPLERFFEGDGTQ